ncbi:hypothetical protein F1728_11180 [Gimesia benthica]|uniref:Uncharacterized protein n=1 Tax=Gimesia benthica TaxID=2608982 RepID=A0A6I6ABV2_9PLAN|nr:hypothetical protein [Gimesia benthica]QGQ23200.1 hypothetical protein F1728_11180 [Gimesia benthica]
MKLLTNFWRDEAGLVMSAELVMLGTVGVIGATVGLSAASTAINDELVEFSHAIRSLDQSYEVQGHTSCRAWTAGSSYRQQDVEKSLADLCGQVEKGNRAVEKKRELKRKAPPTSKELRKKMEAKKRKQQQKKNEA